MTIFPLRMTILLGQHLPQHGKAPDLVEAELCVDAGGLVTGPEEPRDVEAARAHLPHHLGEQDATDALAA